SWWRWALFQRSRKGWFRGDRWRRCSSRSPTRLRSTERARERSHRRAACWPGSSAASPGSPPSSKRIGSAWSASRALARAARCGPGRKRAGGFSTALVVRAMMLLMFLKIAYHILANIKLALASGFQQGATLARSLILIAALLLTIGSEDVAQPDWDLEWLVP